MSDTQAHKEAVASSDGVTVRKRFEADEFPVPAIAFQIVSRRSTPVTVRLVDSVPEDVAAEDLGFHPEYGSEHWDVDEDRIAFEKELESEADYTTVYGIRATGTDDVEKFLTEPAIESVSPPLDEDEELLGSGNDAVRDVISGRSDSVPGLEEGEDEDNDGSDDVETLDLSDPAASGHPAESEASSATLDADAETGSVVAAMAEEIRQQNVSPADVKLLKQALDAVSDTEDGTDGVNEARIRRLQQDIADLRAYTDALEAFLEENGTGEEMIAEFSDRLDTFESSLDSFEDDIESAKSTAAEASEDVEELATEIETVETRIGDLEDDVDALREELGDGEIDDRLSSLESDLDDLEQWRDQLSSVIGGGDT